VTTSPSLLPLVSLLLAVLALLAPLGAPAAAHAQAAANPSAAKSTSTKTGARAPAPPSTLDGLYTDEQAGRGKDVYLAACRSCHTPMSHTGATFNKWWRGKKLSDLFLFVETQMPKNDPGSLAVEDVADVVAYLLKMNAMPVGKVELYPDPDSLKKYRIESKRSSSPSTATRKKP
jgi:mono/diheme cytochrome c family protein